MTLEEKIDQLRVYFWVNALSGWETYFNMSLEEKIEAVKNLSAEKIMRKIGWGGMAILLRDLPPEDAAEKSNEIQHTALEKTRSGIPVLIHDEGLHGLLCNGATSFPQAIGMASSWAPELVEQVAQIIGKEAKARGIRQLLSPTVNIARDVRAGRTEETYGEDPYLTSRMAVAFVRGLQSQKVVATPKHFVANFVGDGGRDSNAIHFSERLLREIYLPAFEASVKESDAWSIMSAYNSYDGVPCSCHRWLLTDVLRKEWKFRGFVVSDYGSVLGIMEKHNVAKTKAEAGIKALEAGLDMELPSPDCFGREFLKAAKSGRVSKKAIDRAVSSILRVKFLLGLFDEPYVDPTYAAEISDCPEHRAIALKMARESIVLLKNDGNLLPLSPKLKSIAVIGPNADEIRLGGYSWAHYTKDKIVTPLQGIRNKVSERTRVRFAEGCKVCDTSRDGFQEAIKIARVSEVAVLCMGNSDETEGEGKDRANLDLPGVQEELIKAVADTGVPVVVVLINGSAITMLNWIDKVSAILEAWYPGEEGGTAIADVLFGDYTPGGKLPITFPRSVGQLPLYYNHLPTGRGYDYVDMSGTPLFPFGYGLSYTTFEYSNLRISPKKISTRGSVTISVDVTNTGSYKGDEVVQLYIHDVVASVARPVKELKGFKRITLEPAETKKVTFTLRAQQLGFYNA
ncbi:glycoside hydrolase family 3 C-terminal domain-containing protein, partial [Candidatus Sumerlaeota bacterium]|nr:glycoside hydrolase family 3 C-terminal domain-containing protein [Candidatus Sumerlaeota bacterium]